MIDKSFCWVHRDNELCSVIEDPEQIVKTFVKGVFDNVIAKNEVSKPDRMNEFNRFTCQYCARHAVCYALSQIAPGECGLVFVCPDHE